MGQLQKIYSMVRKKGTGAVGIQRDLSSQPGKTKEGLQKEVERKA